MDPLAELTQRLEQLETRQAEYLPEIPVQQARALDARVSSLEGRLERIEIGLEQRFEMLDQQPAAPAPQPVQQVLEGLAKVVVPAFGFAFLTNWWAVESGWPWIAAIVATVCGVVLILSYSARVSR